MAKKQVPIQAGLYGVVIRNCIIIPMDKHRMAELRKFLDRLMAKKQRAGKALRDAGGVG